MLLLPEPVRSGMCNVSLTKHSDEQHIQRTVVVPDSAFEAAANLSAIMRHACGVKEPPKGSLAGGDCRCN